MCRFLVSTNPEIDLGSFKEGLARMKNGGPDATGYYTDGNIMMGHNRLSIVDLDGGNQPMEIDGCVIVFNGEIYNHKDLKIKHSLKCDTESDTEVILRLYLSSKEASGPIRTRDIFSELIGEFSFVIYDRNSNVLMWMRDPMGVKPLYLDSQAFTASSPCIVLSSEIKGITRSKAVSNLSIKSLLGYGFTGETDSTMYRNIQACLPGRLYILNLVTSSYDALFGNTLPYKDLTRKKSSLRSGGSFHPESNIKDVIEMAVKRRLMADVPIACTLSGGIDSAIIAYFAQKHSKIKLNTYTIGFKGYDNEFEQARRVAKYIGTNHHEIEIDPKEILENIDEIIETIECPADKGSTIPTFFLARAMKNEKVVLVGDGADEIFAGYNRYQEFKEGMGRYEYLLKYMQVFSGPDEVAMAQRSTHQIYDSNDILIDDLEGELASYHNMRIDKMFMHFGTEARPPFLDVDVVTNAMLIPLRDKVNPTKKCLRDAFRGILPDWIVDQPKKPLKLSPIDDLLKLPEVKEVILDDNITRDIESNMQNQRITDILISTNLEEIYNEPDDSRNKSRKLWLVYLFKKWYAKNYN